jgi:hypothetical protein
MVEAAVSDPLFERNFLEFSLSLKLFVSSTTSSSFLLEGCFFPSPKARLRILRMML